MLPASETKHLKEVSFDFGGEYFNLRQRDEHGLTNGTTLWLGGQVLSYYLLSILGKEGVSSKGSNTARGNSVRRKRAIELGGGIGMTTYARPRAAYDFLTKNMDRLALYSLGWEVCATDVEPVLSTVLRPNVAANTSHGTKGENAHNGVVECRELDWMVEPERWQWDGGSAIAQHKRDDAMTSNESEDTSREPLDPSFDLIVTADTLYIAELVTPLLRTLHRLAHLSLSPKRSSSRRYSSPVYVAVERRDPQVMDQAYAEAKTVWGFAVEKIRSVKIRKALERAGVDWGREREAWEGVEIWKLRLTASGGSPGH